MRDPLIGSSAAAHHSGVPCEHAHRINVNRMNTSKSGFQDALYVKTQLFRVSGLSMVLWRARILFSFYWGVAVAIGK